MGDPEIASCPPAVSYYWGLMSGCLSCITCNLALPSRQCAQYAPYLLVPTGTFDTCTSVDCAATFMNELEHGHASVVPMTDGVTILVSR